MDISLEQCEEIPEGNTLSARAGNVVKKQQVRRNKDAVPSPVKPTGSRSPARSPARAGVARDKPTASATRAAATTAHRHSQSISAQKYMTQHRLLEAMHTALQAAVTDRPADPILHMAQKLMELTQDRPTKSPLLSEQGQVPRTSTNDKKRSKGKVKQIPEEVAVDSSATLQPAPEPSPGQALQRTPGRGPMSNGFTLPPLEPKADGAAPGGDATRDSGSSATLLHIPSAPCSALQDLEVASDAQAGDIEGELDGELEAEEAARGILDQGLRAVEMPFARQDTAARTEGPPIPAAGPHSPSSSSSPLWGSQTSPLERELRAKAAGLRRETSTPLAQREVSSEAVSPNSSGVRDESRQGQPQELSRRLLHADAAEQRQTPPASPQAAPSRGMLASLEQAVSSPHPAVSPFSVTSTVDQGLVDEEDLVQASAVKDLARQGVKELQRTEHKDREVLETIRQRLLAGFVAKREMGHIDSIIQRCCEAS